MMSQKEKAANLKKAVVEVIRNPGDFESLMGLVVHSSRALQQGSGLVWPQVETVINEALEETDAG